MYEVTIKNGNKTLKINDLKDLADVLIGYGINDTDIKVAVEYLSKSKFNATFYHKDFKVAVVKDDVEDKWFRIDEYQFCKKNKSGVYLFADILWLDRTGDEPDFDGTNDYVFKYGIVDLDCYSEYDKECLVTSYYPDGLKEVRKTYGDNADQIIAECIFEQMTDGECICAKFMTLEDAEKRLIEFVGKENYYYGL